MPRYLQQRRRRWYAILEIPEALRPLFGRARFVQSLETKSLTVAERRVLSVVAIWKGLLDDASRQSAGSTPALEAEVRRIRYEFEKLAVEPDEANEQWVHDLVTHAAEAVEEKFEGAGLEVFHRITGKAVLLSEFVEDWLSSLSNEQKTIDMKRTDLARLCKKFRLASDITPRQVKRWIEEDLQGKDELKVASVKRMLSAYRGYWDYLLDTEKLNAPNPFMGAISARRTKLSKQEVTSRRDTRRKAFSQDDIRKLVEACGEDDELRKLIILAAFTGARIEELCSLKINNVSKTKFTIVDAKTDAGWREIPVHPKITKFVENLKDASTNEYLFPNLSYNKYQDRSNAIGKRFGRLKGKLGYGGDFVFHSIRKCVASQFETAGIQENLASRILGHDIKTMTYGQYSGGIQIKELAKAMKVISYPKLEV